MTNLEIIILVITCLLVAVFLWKRQIVRGIALSLKIVFLLSLSAVLSGLFVPAIYIQLADNSLQAAGALGTLRTVDGYVTSIQSLPSDLWQDFTDWIQGQSTEAQSGSVQPGPLEANFYPQLLQSYANFLRTLAVALGLGVMGLITYLSFTFYSAEQVGKLERRVADLERSLHAMRFPAS